MPVALEQFVKQLADSGVIAPGKLESFVPPNAQPKDAQELAKQLVQSKHLTKFQAQEIYAGRAKSLILGNYTILDKIGAGGMGQVCKAEHRRMHRVVAIKMLPQNVTKDAAAVARFQREVEAASKLLHPNIVSAFDADEANGVHFLAMEYVEGSDLSALVKKNGPFPLAKAVNYILQAARGLEFAHAEGVVHRDIKPANLLLDKKGTVKILDMGLARISTGDDAATQAELTGTGAVLGTVDYMAPEQALSTKHADARADIYSLGCSLHYLIAGKATYDGDTLMAKLLAHREKLIPSLGAEVPQELQAVFEKMVAKKVEDRYQTMGEVVAALEQCSAGSQTSISIQQSVDTSLESDALTFLKDAPPHASHIAKKIKKAAPVKPGPAKAGTATAGSPKRKFVLGAIGAGFLGVAILAAVIFKLRTKDGTLVVEVDQPDATVQVLDAEGKVEISQRGGTGAITISVDPGKHRLKVEKGGFQFFAQDFEMDSGGTASIKASLVEDKPWFTPAFLEWQKHVAALPAKDAADAVARKLQELNHDFDGKLTSADWNAPPKVEAGAVTQLALKTDNVSDLSPVRTLVGLKELICPAYADKPGLEDISPLRGLKLSSLQFYWTKVSDLSPVEGMPLTTLICGGSPVSDLSPLRGMRLTTLNCSRSKVSDLSPLQGMPLTELQLNDTPVSDVSALRGMSLTSIILTPKNITRGMNLIRGMKSLTVIGVGDGDTFSPDVFWKKYDAGEFGKPAASADSSSGKTITTSNAPGFQAWMKTVAVLPAEKQVEAVVKKLQLLNPGFDGRETHKIDNGVVTEFRLGSSPVADIAPVRAFAGLRELAVESQFAADKSLVDLSPLAGMKLSGLSCKDCGRVSDLSPLRGMPLHWLNCSGTGVCDFSPLRGMPLESLDCWSTPTSDLSQLKGMRLEHISCADDRISDLSPLAGMPLEDLNLQGTSVSRVEPLSGMPLRYLTLNGTRVSDLSPLVGMPLEWLSIDSTPVPDLRSLRGVHFAQLSCRRTNVADLSPLRGMPLKFLDCSATRVSDLSPLVGMPLEGLWCEGTGVSDFSPLAGMGLKDIRLTPKNITKGLEAIRAMRSLEKIGISSGLDSSEPLKAAEFWSRYDDGQLLPWQPGTVNEIKSLPPEQQLQAVVKKLQQLNPGFNGEEKHNIEAGAVTELEVGWRKLSDISPLRVLTGLKRLMVGRAHVFDLEPLRGLPLVDLNCGETDVYDLSPLKGMKLTVLHCDSTLVADLSPLAGIPLASLDCGGTRVTDLRPLAGMPITNLSLSWTRVQDASPLTGMPLAELDCSGTDVADLSPLNGMQLRVLRLRGPSLAALAGARLKVENLDCSNSDVSDLSPLKGIDIASLDCSKTRVSELAPLKGLRLWRLWCNDTAVHDLSPLAGMPLSEINLARTRVSDLSPLKQMQLNVIACDETAVADLAPLKGMPLGGWLLCNGTPVSDLSPLKGMALKEFAFSPQTVTKGIEVIRAMNSLEKIGIRFDQEFPAAEFWKKYDAGEFTKSQ